MKNFNWMIFLGLAVFLQSSILADSGQSEDPASTQVAGEQVQEDLADDQADSDLTRGPGSLSGAIVSAAMDGCPIVGADEVGLALRITCSTGNKNTDDNIMEVTSKVMKALEAFKKRPEYKSFELIMLAIKEKIDEMREKSKTVKIKIGVELELDGVSYKDSDE